LPDAVGRTRPSAAAAARRSPVLHRTPGGPATAPTSGETVHQGGHQAGYRGDLRDGLAFHQRRKGFRVAVLRVVRPRIMVAPAARPCQPIPYRPSRECQSRLATGGLSSAFGGIVPQLPIQPGRHRHVEYPPRPLGFPVDPEVKTRYNRIVGTRQPWPRRRRLRSLAMTACTSGSSSERNGKPHTRPGHGVDRLSTVATTTWGATSSSMKLLTCHWIGRIDREICAAGLDDRQQCHHHVEAPDGSTARTNDPGTHTAIGEQCRQVIRTAIAAQRSRGPQPEHRTATPPSSALPAGLKHFRHRALAGRPPG